MKFNLCFSLFTVRARFREERSGLLVVACLLVVGLLGCQRSQVAVSEASQQAPLFFPPPPHLPHVQYLGAINSPADLPRQRDTFADFLLGEEPVRYPVIKPISAAISGTKLYVCDMTMGTVLVYDLNTGEAGPLAGDRGMGKINKPNNIEIDDEGRIYVADKARQAVLVYGPDGEFIDGWGRPGEVLPVAVAVGENEMYVCDIKDHQIEVWDRSTGEFLRAFGRKGVLPGQFVFPTQITIGPDGNLYVTDTANFRIQKLTPAGDALQSFGHHGTALGELAWPKGMDVDARGLVYVADSRFANVQIFNPEGQLLLFFGGPGPDNGNLDLPAGLTVMPWPSLPILEQKLAPGFVPESLVIAVSQKGMGLINFYAVAGDPMEQP